MKIKIVEPAELELDDSYEYYENESAGSGKKFIDEFRNTLNRIITFPEAWTIIQNNIRKCLFKRFPYSIIYALEKEVIIILAVSHHHRHPDYWIDRI